MMQALASMLACSLCAYTAGLTRSASVHLSNISCVRFGLDRNAKYRGLRSLESVRLIAVKRMLGQSPLVTILDGGGAV